MTYITLDIVKKHCNLDSTFTDDDAYLSMLWDVCLDVIQKHIDHRLSELAALNGNALPPSLKHAALLLLGTYYQNREHVAFASANELPNSFTYLLSLYQDYAGQNITVTSDDLLGEIEDSLANLTSATGNLTTATESLLNTTEDLQDRAEALENKTIEGESPINVGVQGSVTTVSLNDVNLGEY